MCCCDYTYCLQDITLVNAGNPDLKDGMVNMEKMVLLDSAIKKLVRTTTLWSAQTLTA
jgi:hypothetical protein